ncbi:MAG: hypothetical protein MUE71_03865 [Chitinophagaceae bacterium]|nr:hypothetical protein [Chitinophagaceae bacterium]
MQIVEVRSPQTEALFLETSPGLYKNDPNYIRPLDKDMDDVFNPAKNKSFKDGKLNRWVLLDSNGNSIGRIAAFTSKKYKNKGDKIPVGCFGFFECINDREAAFLLLDTAKNWLKNEGMEAMDGPVNFGERDKWWGLVVEGFYSPLYGMNYNHPYYPDLFKAYGLEVFYYQNCYNRMVMGELEPRFYEGHKKLAERGGFSARMVEKSNIEKYALDFVKVYNSAWAKHEGNKEMTEQAAKKLFKAMKPVIDEKIAWFAYYKDEPIGMYINIPDLNQIFRKFNGRFGLIEKIRFVLFKRFVGFKKMVGIIFGIVPRFHGSGADYFMIVEAAKVIQHQSVYQETELQWIGDWNPKMNNIAKHLGFSVCRRLATFRYLFDRTIPFERHPFL